MSSSVVEVTDQNFESEVTDSDQPVLIDFWGDWCPPCQQLAPIIDSLAEKYQGRVKVAKAKLDDARKAAVRMRINALPTLVVLRNGQPVETMIGTQSLDRLSACLDRHLASAGVSENPQVQMPGA
jgi:thioredoxin 1